MVKKLLILALIIGAFIYLPKYLHNKKDTKVLGITTHIGNTIDKIPFSQQITSALTNSASGAAQIVRGEVKKAICQ